MNYDYERKNKQKLQETNLFTLYLKLLKFYKLYNYNFIFIKFILQIKYNIFFFDISNIDLD